MLRTTLFALLSLTAATACGTAKPGGMSGPSMGRMNPEPAASEVVSTGILDREPLVNKAEVKHILIGFRTKADAYQGSMDPRAVQRPQVEAEELVRRLLAEIKAGASFEALMAQHSEDKGSAETGRSYTVSPDAQLVLPFRQLGLRLAVDEVGVVESDYGFHIIKRVS